MQATNESRIEIINPCGVKLRRRREEMAQLNTLLLPELDPLLLSGLAVLFAGFTFVSAVEEWRRWSEHRRLRKHFRH